MPNNGKTPAARRAYWYDCLEPEERDDLNLIERSIANQEQILKRHLAEMRANLMKLRAQRAILVNRGNGRARYRSVGRQEYLAKKGQP